MHGVVLSGEGGEGGLIEAGAQRPNAVPCFSKESDEDMRLATEGVESGRPVKFRGQLYKGVHERDPKNKLWTVDDLRSLDLRGEDVFVEHNSRIGKIGEICSSWVSDDGWLWIEGLIYGPDKIPKGVYEDAKQALLSKVYKNLSISWIGPREVVDGKKGPVKYKIFREASIVAKGKYEGTSIVSVEASAEGRTDAPPDNGTGPALVSVDLAGGEGGGEPGGLELCGLAPAGASPEGAESGAHYKSPDPDGHTQQTSSQPAATARAADHTIVTTTASAEGGDSTRDTGDGSREEARDAQQNRAAPSPIKTGPRPSDPTTDRAGDPTRTEKKIMAAEKPFDPTAILRELNAEYEGINLAPSDLDPENPVKSVLAKFSSLLKDKDRKNRELEAHAKALEKDASAFKAHEKRTAEIRAEEEQPFVDALVKEACAQAKDPNVVAPALKKYFRGLANDRDADAQWCAIKGILAGYQKRGEEIADLSKKCEEMSREQESKKVYRMASEVASAGAGKSSTEGRFGTSQTPLCGAKRARFAEEDAEPEGEQPDDPEQEAREELEAEEASAGTKMARYSEQSPGVTTEGRYDEARRKALQARYRHAPSLQNLKPGHPLASSSFAAYGKKPAGRIFMEPGAGTWGKNEYEKSLMLGNAR